jgi:Zn-dependent protease with chaperone function/uncharacterized tellurite resistance protein B-like protein
MAVEPRTYQARRDVELRESLLAQREVERAITKVKELTSGYGLVGRRRLLTGALRLTRSMSPEIADTLQRCRETLNYDWPVEIFVRPEPVFNAYCMKNASGPVVIVLSSRLVEAFSPSELAFVIGHELGHATFDHFGIPMPLTATVEDMAGTMVSRPTALQLYLWCRAAEISADRAGLLCARDPEAAATGFFKLASGISSERVRTDLEAYAAQVESLASTPDARRKPRDDDDTLDCFSTHPYSPVRVRAVLAFAKSKVYRQATGQGSSGLEMDEVDALVDRDLQLMDPSYLENKDSTSQWMRRLLYTAGVAVAAANGEIDKREILALQALLGADEVSHHIEVERVVKELDGRIEDAVKNSPLAYRAQLVQHLTVVAGADGVVDDAELAEMCRIADKLGVDTNVVTQTLNGAAWPMD